MWLPSSTTIYVIKYFKGSYLSPLTLQLLKIPLHYSCKIEVRHAISNREKGFVVEALETAINLLP